MHGSCVSYRWNVTESKGYELTECSEIMESDHRGHLTDVDFAEHFSEDFVEDEKRVERNLNLNKKINRQKFVEKCNTLLDIICIESDLIEVNINVNRAKIEQVDSDITRVLTKARKSTEGDAIRTKKSSEQRELRSTLSHWKLMLR